MKSFFYFLFVFVLINVINTKTYCQFRFFCHATVEANVCTRDLSPVSGIYTDKTKIFYKKRRKAERPALREGGFFGIGVAFTTKATIRTGIAYKNFGDREKAEIYLYNESSGTFMSKNRAIKHSFKYISFPLAFSYKIYSTQKFNVNLSLFGSYSIFLSESSKIRKSKNQTIIGNYSGYPVYFTTINHNPITIGLGAFTEKKLNDNLALELGIKGGYHINTSFIREVTTKQSLLFVGLNLGLVKYF